MSTNRSLSMEDLRVRRTRKLLSDALIALLEQHPFEGITVREICERAMVHRATFYTHFTDKYDLLKYILKNTQDDLTQLQQNKEQPEKTKHFHLPIIEYVVSRQALFSLLLVDKEGESLTTLMRHQITEMAVVQLTHLQNSGLHYSIPIPVIAQFYAGAVLAVITWWLENDMPLSTEKLTRYLDQLLSHAGEGLENFKEVD